MICNMRSICKTDEQILLEARKKKILECIGELNLFKELNTNNDYYCSWTLIPGKIHLRYNLELEYFSWQDSRAAPGLGYISFEKILSSVSPEIQTKLLFNLDLFR